MEQRDEALARARNDYSKLEEKLVLKNLRGRQNALILKNARQRLQKMLKRLVKTTKMR